MARKNKQKRRAKAAAAGASPPRNRVRRVDLVVTELEVDLGHDGPFRGAPEPCVLLALYGVAGGQASFLGRTRAVFHPDDAFPCRVPVAGEARLAVEAGRVPGAGVVALAIALEVDGGADVGRVYAGLNDPAALLVWRAEDAVPAPVPVASLPLGGPFAARLLHAGADPAESCGDDEWIGASLVAFPLSETGTREHRLRFRAPDGRNDWTALVRVRIR